MMAHGVGEAKVGVVLWMKALTPLHSIREDMEEMMNHPNLGSKMEDESVHT